MNRPARRDDARPRGNAFRSMLRGRGALFDSSRLRADVSVDLAIAHPPVCVDACVRHYIKLSLKTFGLFSPSLTHMILQFYFPNF